MACADTLTVSPSAGAVLADGFPNLTAKETVMPQIGQFTRDEAGFIDNPLLGLKGINDEHTQGGRLSARLKLGDATVLTASTS